MIPLDLLGHQQVKRANNIAMIILHLELRFKGGLTG